MRTVEEALVELFKKQRPGEPPTLEASRNLLWNICFDPKRYDLTRVGRHKLKPGSGCIPISMCARSQKRTSSRWCANS